MIQAGSARGVFAPRRAGAMAPKRPLMMKRFAPQHPSQVANVAAVEMPMTGERDPFPRKAVRGRTSASGGCAPPGTRPRPPASAN